MFISNSELYYKFVHLYVENVKYLMFSEVKMKCELDSHLQILFKLQTAAVS